MNEPTKEINTKLSEAMLGNTHRLGYKVTDEKVLRRMSRAAKKWHRSKGHKMSKNKKEKL